MTKDRKTPDAFSLPFWMSGTEAIKLAQAAHAWFSTLGRIAFRGADQQDPLTCDATALDLIAWQRGVTRRPTESEHLYRLRTHYAYDNAKDAGSAAGWKRILQRLDLLAPEELTLEERIAGQDWDIVGIFLTDQRQAELQDLIEWVMIEEYGRTCRRYHLVARVGDELTLSMGLFDNDHTLFEAALPTDFAIPFTPDAGIFTDDHNTVEAVWL